ncbi:hypothetical protein B0T26DRAFT_638517 [Lasiosphaeria miniovina]|uniref:Uncharacterized protein n=1 Tax=Lasiosphaeria miniovina TaxID=1954250 RepID=A0AA40E9L5_9PEZI|nr:uncharacterized protein B0T26DRAFT_638517 [Lasiosphaeria miniovina]KAK0727443.1 hypothetical protein B0T26DRAFT_638517 [Lasiosphaeria miniovina]
MDPAFHEARQRFTKPKPKLPSFPLTKFQRHLARNPYAIALASPVRECPITATKVPRFFLQGFNLLKPNETTKAWFVPRDLEKKEKRVPAESEEAEADEEASQPPAESNEIETEEAKTGLPPAAEGKQHSTTATADSRRVGIATGSGSYILAHQELLKKFLVAGSKFRDGHKKLFRGGASVRYKKALNGAVWRKDMHTFLLELMRRRLAEELISLATMVEKDHRQYIVKCASYGAAKEEKHRGCLLYLGPPHADSAEEANPEAIQSSPAPAAVSPSVPEPPARFSTMAVEGARNYGRTLAVHDLRPVLGPEHLNRLRQGSALFRDGELFLLARQRSLPTQLKLLKIQNYLPREAS